MEVRIEFQKALYRMNRLVHKWVVEHEDIYPDAFPIMYEFQGYYRRMDDDEGAVMLLFDENHGGPDMYPCVGTYALTKENANGDVVQLKTLRAYFSNEELTEILVQALDDAFLESNFCPEYPSKTAAFALDSLRIEKGEDYFNEGFVTLRMRIDPGVAEPVYQFGGGAGSETFDWVGVNTLRVNVPNGYDRYIPHKPWEGIDYTDDGEDDDSKEGSEDGGKQNPDKNPILKKKKKAYVPDLDGDRIVTFLEYFNMYTKPVIM